ncbi:cytosolic protein [Ectobacillus ponti]|uniref:Cytosolic protein n=1 Tax=Ectobacillus ponti TaxID=2961894 RepID=A0AA41X1W2_9BACI|nr:cytosolic protein [Ectobacillus ponti]MCP8967416.1 cytosolic protein [Ectobacillus ponti]
MGLVQNIKGFFSTHAETTDTHRDEGLRSRYYKTNKQNAMKAVEELLRGMKGMKITSVSEERGEISVQTIAPKKALVIVTVITIRPFETAVDFSVSSETALPTDFGFSRKLVLELYRQLDKQLVFVGTGLGQKL